METKEIIELCYGLNEKRKKEILEFMYDNEFNFLKKINNLLFENPLENVHIGKLVEERLNFLAHKIVKLHHLNLEGGIINEER